MTLGYDTDYGPVIKQIGDMMDRNLDRALRGKGITSSQCRILVTMATGYDGCMTQKQLEEEFFISHPTVVGLVRRLSGKGLVTVPERSGNGSKEVVITDAGRELVEEVSGVLSETEEDIARGMGPDEKEELMRLLRIVHSNLAEGGLRCSVASLFLH